MFTPITRRKRRSVYRLSSRLVCRQTSSSPPISLSTVEGISENAYLADTPSVCTIMSPVRVSCAKSCSPRGSLCRTHKRKFFINANGLPVISSLSRSLIVFATRACRTLTFFTPVSPCGKKGQFGRTQEREVVDVSPCLDTPVPPRFRRNSGRLIRRAAYQIRFHCCPSPPKLLSNGAPVQ